MDKRYCHIFFDEFPKDSRIRRYTNILLEQGYNVFIICLKTSGKKFVEKQKNLFVYRIPIKKKRGSFSRRLFEYVVFQVLTFFLVSYIKIRYNATIYHVHTLPDFLVFSCLLPKLLGSKIILDFHELFPEFMLQHKPHLSFNSLLVKIILTQEKMSFMFADEIIAFHEPAKNILEKRIPSKKKISVIMNGVDVNEIKNYKKRYDGKFNIIYNGTINYNLNLTLVVKALSLIKKNEPEIYKNIQFLIYGDGPDIDNILLTAKELKIENVFYESRVEYDKMISKLEVASLCILPPRKDIYSDLFYSLKMLEMIYFEIPIIATKLDTYMKYYPEDCIFYFDSDNHFELAEKIIYVYNNPIVVNGFTKRALNQYNKYSWEIMKNRYEELIHKLNG